MVDSEINTSQIAEIDFLSGGQKNTRKYRRYKISAPASITFLIYENYAYMLYKPFKVKLVDISQNGVKLRASFEALPVGCKFELQFKINGKIKHLLTECKHESHLSDKVSEYGCQFYSTEKLIQRIAL